MTLVLWDIDGTLLHAGGVDKQVWYDVCTALTGRPPATLTGISGRTDPQILLDTLLACGVDHDQAELLLPEALARQVTLLAERSLDLRTRGHRLPGAAEALAALAGRAGVVQSVVTGNVRDNAALKLASFGLDRHLDLSIGAFGSDDKDRACLVRIAQARLHESRGIDIADDRTVLIGDSARDVHAAKSCRIRSVAVATGRTEAATLASAGADVVLEDLTDLNAVLAAIL